MNKDLGAIYLSGGMEKTSADDPLGAKWREDVSREIEKLGFFSLNITELDSAYNDEHGDLFNVSSDGITEEMAMLQKKANIRKHFIKADLQLIIHDSDALIVYYDDSVRKGAGTISECQIAFNNDIPVFIVSAYEDPSEIPGWLLALSTKIFFSFDDLYTYLGRLPEGILKRDIYKNHHSGQYYLCSLSGEPFEKAGTHFVSEVSPLYSKESVEIVKHTNENMKDRYEFFVEHLKEKGFYD